MIKLLLKITFLVIFSGIIWFLFEFDQKIHLSFMEYDIEISLIFLGILCLVFFVILRLIEIILKSPFTLLAKFRRGSELNNAHMAVSFYEQILTGNLKKAEKLINKIKNPETISKNFKDLSTALISKEKSDDANFLTATMNLLDSDETHMFALKKLTEYYKKIENHAKALEFANKAWKIDPKAKWVNEELCKLLQESHDFEKALEILNASKKFGFISEELFKTETVKTIFNLANKQLQTDEINEAVKNLEKIYKIDPKFIDAGILLSKIYIEQNSPKKAEKIIEKYWINSPNPELAEAVIGLFPENKIKILENLAKSNPDSKKSREIVANLIQKVKFNT